MIDLPPGTADLQQDFFRDVRLSGVLVVVGPQDAAHLDARKLLDLLRAADVLLDARPFAELARVLAERLDR